MSVNETILKKGDNEARLYYLLDELVNSRFWFGAGKSKGLGRTRLELDKPLPTPPVLPTINPKTNHLRVTVTFDAQNPVLVGWNWGKIDPEIPSFAAVEGKILVGALREIPPALSQRLQMVLSGPILNPDDWKKRLTEYLPRTTAVWLQEQCVGEVEIWTLPKTSLIKLGKGKYRLAKNLLDNLAPIAEKSYDSLDLLEAAIAEAMETKPNMIKRVTKSLKQSIQTGFVFNENAWNEIADAFGFDASLSNDIIAQIQNETALTTLLDKAYQPNLPRFYEQIDQQIQLLQSDAWVNAEIENRQQHLDIKQMILDGKINERQWHDQHDAPQGVTIFAWREFLDSHHRVRFNHIKDNRNLRKSIVNDQNMIAFLNSYRDRARQELSQPHHIDFRAGGRSNREISRKYGKPYDTVFMRMLSWAASNQSEGMWEVYIPGSTIKGAFRKRASQILKTLWGDTRKTANIIDRLFGKQGQVGLIFFSDAYLSDPQNPEKSWCSMDGVKMDPNTGQPITSAKQDYLYAYGQNLVFNLQMDLQDIDEFDIDAISLLIHLLQDFRIGDIPLGGNKTSGFGWVKANITQVDWLTGNPDDVGQWLFGGLEITSTGPWYGLSLLGAEAFGVLSTAKSMAQDSQYKAADSPIRTDAGFVSHRSFGGYSGRLEVEAEVLTPLMVQESGEPSYTTVLQGEPINGWDFFSMAPGAAAQRSNDRIYALPSKSLRGMLRHIYAIASDSSQESPNLAQMNPVDSLFGWVGSGQNQAIMGRVVIGFAHFEAPEQAWFKSPYPYGRWQYVQGDWRKVDGGTVVKHHINKQWRIFRHTPLAPVVQQLDDFTPDTAQAYYGRAILPGSKARFTIRFWNLEQEELERLAWCIALQPGLAHKIGKTRYLGFGSLRLRILPDSFLIDWATRYSKKTDSDWRQPFDVARWVNNKTVLHYRALQQALNAQQL